MTDKPGLFSAKGFLGIFNRESVSTQLERRVRNLPVADDRRGPRCAACGFGTLYVIAIGMPDAGRMRCNRAGCAFVCDSAPEQPAPAQQKPGQQAQGPQTQGPQTQGLQTQGQQAQARKPEYAGG